MPAEAWDAVRPGGLEPRRYVGGIWDMWAHSPYQGSQLSGDL
jgi:hypothetical protein